MLFPHEGRMALNEIGSSQPVSSGLAKAPLFRDEIGFLKKVRSLASPIPRRPVYTSLESTKYPMHTLLLYRRLALFALPSPAILQYRRAPSSAARNYEREYTFRSPGYFARDEAVADAPLSFAHGDSLEHGGSLRKRSIGTITTGLVLIPAGVHRASAKAYQGVRGREPTSERCQSEKVRSRDTSRPLATGESQTVMMPIRYSTSCNDEILAEFEPMACVCHTLALCSLSICLSPSLTLSLHLPVDLPVNLPNYLLVRTRRQR